ncbi:GDP-mannose 4,6-dehydratase [Patescibacteria group bacterium]|nr:GDP-mannose 4,6-dehydratase [Patescibacteria group bacterium]
MKNVIVTGATGFLGHHMVKYILANTDWNVIAMGRENFAGNLNRIMELEEYKKDKDRVHIVWHDFRSSVNPSVKEQITRGKKINYIFHIAASSHVTRSIQDPLSFVFDNVVGTAHALEFARDLDGLEKFLYFSTDEVFGPVLKPGYKFKPDDRYNARNPYSATKAGGEELCVAYQNTYNLPVVITHCMNILGERQHTEKYLPKIIKYILKGKTLTVHTEKGSAKPGKRYYIYAGEVCNATLFLIENGVAGEKYNIEGQREIDNLALAKLVASTLGKKLKYTLVPGDIDRPGHDQDYAISGEKLRKLGYKPIFDFDKELERTIKWYANNTRWLC